MKFRIYSDLLRDTTAFFKISMVVNLVLALVVVFLAFHNGSLATRVKTIVVPTHLRAQVEIQGDSLSPEYVRIMLLHLTHLMYSYTPYTIDSQYREFQAYIPTENIDSVKDTLQKRRDQVLRLKIHESFLLSDLHFIGANTAAVKGRILRWATGQELASDDLIVKYSYQATDGGFRVTEISLLTSSELSALLRADK